MSELDRRIKDIEALYYGELFAMALNDILEISQKDSIQSVKEMKKMVEARFLRLREDLAMISKFWKRVNNEKEKDEKIERLKYLVIKQTKTSESTLEYVREIGRLLEQEKNSRLNKFV